MRTVFHVREYGRRKISLSHRVQACMMLSFSHHPCGAFMSPYEQASHQYFQGVFRCYHRESFTRGKRESYMAASASDDTAAAYEWKVGNVYDDLDRLQEEIAISQAEQHLRQVEDRERLDTFAFQRRPLQRDVRRFLLAPLFSSVFLSLVNRSHLARFYHFVFNLHFFVAVIAAPMVLLLAKRRSLPPPPPPPEELTGLDPDYYRFVVTDWQDPKTSCRDHILCLLENWTSAVVGPALLACICCLLPRTVIYPVNLAMAASQLITRLGATAALHQYPKLLFQLRQRHQPRPMDRYSMRLQQITWLVLTAAPFGVASDLAQVINQLPSQLAASFLGLGLTRFCKYHLWRGTASRPLTRIISLRQSFVGTALSLVQLAALWNLVDILRGWRMPMMPSYTALAATAVYLLLLVGPICHLVAIRKLVRVSYTHDISLASDYDTISTILSDPTERRTRFKWRYRLEWREPERILQTLSKWKGGFSYWLLFQGGVEDQLRKEFQATQKGAAHRQGLTVLQRCEQEMKKNPDAPRPNSRLWKQNAMENLAARHEKDYTSGSFEDPLGVAVQQTFGIGLGYQFDHWTELKDGEHPSARRLQARAAKSAVKRAQEIYDAAAAQKELDSIEDPKERSCKQAAMRRSAEVEMAYIASTLANLIPTDLGLDTKRQTKIQQFAKKRDYKRSSSHEIIIEDFPTADSSSLDSLLGQPGDNETDEEFVEAWFKRQQGADDDDVLTALV